jgi:hypothetical protein
MQHPVWCGPIGPGFRLSLRREALKTTLRVAVVHKDALQRIGSDEDDPDEELLLRDLWEDETQRDVLIDSLKAGCEVRAGRPPSP